MSNLFDVVFAEEKRQKRKEQQQALQAQQQPHQVLQKQPQMRPGAPGGPPGVSPVVGSSGVAPGAVGPGAVGPGAVGPGAGGPGVAPGVAPGVVGSRTVGPGLHSLSPGMGGGIASMGPQQRMPFSQQGPGGSHLVGLPGPSPDGAPTPPQMSQGMVVQGQGLTPFNQQGQTPTTTSQFPVNNGAGKFNNDFFLSS